MINLVMVYIEHDLKLNNYFKNCADAVRTHCDNDFRIIDITNNQCNSVYIEETIKSLGNNKFIFISFSHGNESSLLFNNEPYIEININDHIFRGSFFYTNSCLSGKNLGPSLIDKNCEVFWGYKENVYSVKLYFDIFQECDLSGFKYFVNGFSALESFRKMKNYFDEKIDEIYKNDYSAAAHLLFNRDALVLLGNKNSKITDYNF
jgi:hypothetical protein